MIRFQRNGSRVLETDTSELWEIHIDNCKPFFNKPNKQEWGAYCQVLVRARGQLCWWPWAFFRPWVISKTGWSQWGVILEIWPSAARISARVWSSFLLQWFRRSYVPRVLQFSCIQRFVYSSVVGQLDCFFLLATVINTITNMGVQISVHPFSPPGCIPRSQVAVPYGSSMFNL